MMSSVIALAVFGEAAAESNPSISNPRGGEQQGGLSCRRSRGVETANRFLMGPSSRIDDDGGCESACNGK